jgi:hypothetical protein
MKVSFSNSDPIQTQMVDVLEDESLRPKDRLTKLNLLNGFAELALGNSGGEEAQDLLATLSLTMFTACMPAFEAVATEKGTDKVVADGVVSNLRLQTKNALDWMNQNTGKKGGRYMSDLTGKLSELATLDLLWWGIANNSDRLGSNAWPVYEKDNVQRTQGDGYKTGYDIVVVNADKSQQLVQVKTTLLNKVGRGSKKGETYDYRPDIAVVRPMDLVDGSGLEATLGLLGAFINNDIAVLSDADAKFQVLLAESRRQGQDYFTGLTRAS